MLYRITEIDYDTDGEDVDLPTEMTFEVDELENASSELADLISDRTGWCVNGFQFEAVPYAPPSP